MTAKIVSLVSVAVLCAISGGCHKKEALVHPPAPPPAVQAQAAPAVQRPAPVSAPANQVASTPDTATKARIQDLLNRIQDVYFDYDRHNLRPDAENTLEADAKELTLILRQYPTYKLTIEGYCDERGSEEYNLALGDMRAKRAQTFLVTLGLPASQLRTVSFGKEHPVCTQPDEACWQKNRRAHITQDQQS